jgi:hypothetical protein
MQHPVPLMAAEAQRRHGRTSPTCRHDSGFLLLLLFRFGDCLAELRDRNDLSSSAFPG